MAERLRVNPLLCDAYGHCAELLPQLISRDEWGYPILPSDPVPEHLLAGAKHAVAMCPRLALMLEREKAPDPVGARAPRST
jgi:ferredoxin